MRSYRVALSRKLCIGGLLYKEFVVLFTYTIIFVWHILNPIRDELLKIEGSHQLAMMGTLGKNKNKHRFHINIFCIFVLKKIMKLATRIIQQIKKQFSMSNEITDKWFKLLTLLDQTDYLMKEGDWYIEDKMEFYEMKDKFLSFVIKDRPEELPLEVFYMPYYKYSKQTKDKAGEIMRADDTWRPFEYYLAMVDPSEDDVEVTEKATIEVEITYEDRLFSFQVPLSKTIDWDLDIDELPRKAFLSGKEFHREKFGKIKAELNELMDGVVV